MRVKLALQDYLRVNLPLPWDVYSEQDQLLLSKGMVLQDERQVETLIERGAYVEEDAYEIHKAKVGVDPPPKPESPFAHWDDIHQRLGLLLRRHKSEPGFLKKLSIITADIMDIVDKDIDIAIFSIMRTDMTNYPIAHMLQVGACCDIYGRFVQWEAPVRTSLLNAALTMNIAKLELQQMLTRQIEPPTPEQRQHIHAHPMCAYAWLKEIGVNDTEWLRAVVEHHETGDGKGYPHDIKEVSPLAQVLNMADRYCALMGTRSERKAKMPNIAARELYLATSGERQTIIASIIKGFGLFPPGHFVRLANGEIAVVTHRGEHANKPRIATVITTQGTKLMDPIRRDPHNPDFAITQIVPSDECAIQINPEKLFGLK
jgi:HD-GYP domain-containing protein (c-di-GMP phosphodiesterase class II)